MHNKYTQNFSFLKLQLAEVSLFSSTSHTEFGMIFFILTSLLLNAAFDGNVTASHFQLRQIILQHSPHSCEVLKHHMGRHSCLTIRTKSHATHGISLDFDTNSINFDINNFDFTTNGFDTLRTCYTSIFDYKLSLRRYHSFITSPSQACCWKRRRRTAFGRQECTSRRE